MKPFACKRRMTLLQQEPSAQTPCTSMMFAFLLISILLVDLGLGAKCSVVCGVVCVASCIKGIKGVTVILPERQVLAKPTHQVWIRDEVATECHGVDQSLCDSSVGSIRFETSCGNELALEDGPQLLCRRCALLRMGRDASSHSWLNEMEISKIK